MSIFNTYIIIRYSYHFLKYCQQNLELTVIYFLKPFPKKRECAQSIINETFLEVEMIDALDRKLIQEL
jgi:hypothetical protein